MKGGDVNKWCTDNPILCALVVILVLVLIYHFFFKKERMQPFYLDQMAMQASDPTVVKYLGNERDPIGMSLRDYYLENERNAENVVAPFYNNDWAYSNRTSYLDMPQWYRPPKGYKPRPLAMLVDQTDNVSSSDEGFTGNVNSRSSDAGMGEVIAALKTQENMNQRNKSGRERFFV